MISPFDVESQTLPFALVFDVKQSDGMEGSYTRISGARTERATYHENGTERSSLSVLRSRWQVPSNDGSAERAVNLQTLRPHCFPERYCFYVPLLEVS